MEYKFKQTKALNKNLVNFQFDVLKIKSNAQFYQRQCGYAKMLLQKWSYEDLLLVLKMYANIGIPKWYKSIYYLGKETEKQINMARDWKYITEHKTEKKEVKNIRRIKKVKINTDIF